ncbi:MAG: alpha/beta fold hydrolase [Sphingobium sp.]
MERHYLYTGLHRVHYRRAGEGPPLVVLPAMPGSSQLFEWIAGAFGSGRTLIALDLPGTGESSALPGEPSIADYASWLAETLAALSLPTVDLIAFEASVAVATAFACDNAASVRNLLLVEPPVNGEADAAAYCPPLVPDMEGSHLARHWGRLRDSYMFAPWFDRRSETRLVRDLPPADRLYDEMLDLLRAGPSYARGWALGMAHDWRTDVRGFAGLSILAGPRSIERLRQDGHLADPIADTDDGRAIAEKVSALVAEQSLADAPPAPAVIPCRGEVRRDYVRTSIGQMLVRRIEGDVEGGVPLVIFHGSLWSSANLEPKVKALAGTRPVLTFDLPGVGDSAPLEGMPDMVEFAKIVVEALDALELPLVDLQGGHSGAMIAMDVAILRPDKVRRMILDGVTMFSDEQLDEMLPVYLQPLRITDDGAFLLWGWHFLRDMLAWYPWYDHSAGKARSDARVLDADGQHAYFVDFLKGGRNFAQYYRAALAFDTRARAPMLKVPSLYCCSEADTLREETIEASALSPNASFTFTPGRATPEAAAKTEEMYLHFLDGLPVPAF